MKINTKIGLAAVLLTSSVAAFSATKVDVSKNNIFNRPSLSRDQASDMKEQSRTVDFNKTLHIHMQQMHAGYPVWGANSIVHIPNAPANSKSLVAPKSTANGFVYQQLDADLRDAPAFVFSADQSEKALQAGMSLAKKDFNISGYSSELKDKKSSLIVYVDKDNKAHWAFLVSFYSPRTSAAMPSKPTYILDAQTLTKYKSWNEVKTESFESVAGGGIGGNIKMGKLYYDGQPGHLNTFMVQRDASTGICSLQNHDVIVKDKRSINMGNNAPVEFLCKAQSSEHPGVYWNERDDSVNDGYSPNNDAIYDITFLKGMYQKWYGIEPVTDEKNRPIPITVYTHINMDNADWQGKVGDEWMMELGDGGDVKYPSTAVGVVSHELGHGFTEQHSGLIYEEQSGGLNESFSDMADQAAQYFVFGKNNWMHDAEITKADGRALRYLDQPSKDCYGTKKPGVSCSIDNMSQYNQYTNVHYSSGIFNRVFYLIGSAPGWNAKMAFDIMVDANMNYWIPATTFDQAACGVLQATKDYHYDLKTVKSAFDTVGVDTSSCK